MREIRVAFGVVGHERQIVGVEQPVEWDGPTRAVALDHGTNQLEVIGVHEHVLQRVVLHDLDWVMTLDGLSRVARNSNVVGVDGQRRHVCPFPYGEHQFRTVCMPAVKSMLRRRFWEPDRRTVVTTNA